jgi:hypothetical protein
MKWFWCFGIVVFVLAACQANDPTPSPVPTIQVISTSNHITLVENRVVLTLWEGVNYFADAQNLRIRLLKVQDTKTSTEQTAYWEGAAIAYNDYAIPYWVVYPSFPESGFWYLEATVLTTGGTENQAGLLVKVETDDPSLAVGTVAPLSHNLTMQDPATLYQLTSDSDPNPALYTHTIAEAVTSGQPSLILFASPGLCSNRSCAPVMESTFKPFWEHYQTQINFVHVEVFNLQTSEYVPTMAEWGLNNEPWTYLIDAQGIIVARFDGPVSIAELSPLIQTVLAN